MEGLHHSLGIGGVIIYHSLLKGLVIELLHILSDLGENSGHMLHGGHHQEHSTPPDVLSLVHLSHLVH